MPPTCGSRPASRVTSRKVKCVWAGRGAASRSRLAIQAPSASAGTSRRSRSGLVSAKTLKCAGMVAPPWGEKRAGQARVYSPRGQLTQARSASDGMSRRWRSGLVSDPPAARLLQLIRGDPQHAVRVQGHDVDVAIASLAYAEDHIFRCRHTARQLHEAP